MFRIRLSQLSFLQFPFNSTQSFQSLHKWTTDNPHEFWSFTFSQAPLIYSGSPSTIVTPHTRIDDFPTWFPGVSLNFAEHLLYTGTPSGRTTLHKDPSKTALVEVREAQTSLRHLTWSQLRNRVAGFQSALRAHGVQRGDRVAAVMNNSIDTLCVFLGTVSLGALFSSSSTDMGASGILERLRQIEPRWCFFDDAALYNGATSDLREKMAEIVAGMEGYPGFRGVVSVPRWHDAPLDVSAVKRTVSLAAFLGPHLCKTEKDLEFTRVPFDAGFLIVYSSGTTGQPKCIVHAVGRVLLSSWKEGQLHRGITPDARVLQFTTTGWIMYLASVQTLLFGTRLIMYDGSPFLPGPDAFLRLAAEQGVTHLGTSPRWLQMLRSAGVRPRDIPGTERLRVCTSTGMVLPVELFRWFYSEEGFHSHTQLANISGGTDLAGAFGDCNPLDPVYETGGCQGFSLGMDVRVFDSTQESLDGKPVKGKEMPVGEPGDLVCGASFPNMPTMFWGDEGNKKYLGAYFERFDNAWTHGDFIQVQPETGSVIFLGRADGVLNPSGIRFGSAEVYSVIENEFREEVEDSVCVGQRRKRDQDEKVLLFVKMKKGARFDQGLVTRIKDAVAKGLSRRHVPKYIFETPEIPVSNILTPGGHC